MAELSFSRRRMLGLLGGTALGFAVGCGSSVESAGDEGDTAEAGGPLTVGLLVPQSGVYASLGTDMTNAWNLWLEEHDGMLGGREVRTETADEGETPDSGLAGMQSLLQRNVDVLVGIVSSAVALGAADLVAEQQKLLIVGNAGANDITGAARSPYIWRTSFTNSQVSLPLGEYLASQDDVRDSVYV